MAYRLSVVRASDGDYLVNHYRKTQDTRLSDFAAVVNQLFVYARNPEIFEDEPVLRDLSSEEEKAIENIRNLVLEQRVLVQQK